MTGVLNIACRPCPTRIPNYVGWRQAGRCRNPFGTAHTHNPIGQPGGTCRSVLAPLPGALSLRRRDGRVVRTQAARRRCFLTLDPQCNAPSEFTNADPLAVRSPALFRRAVHARHIAWRQTQWHPHKTMECGR